LSPDGKALSPQVETQRPLLAHNDDSGADRPLTHKFITESCISSMTDIDPWNNSWNRASGRSTYMAPPPVPPTISVNVKKQRGPGRKIFLVIIAFFATFAIIKAASSSQASSGTHHGAAPINSSLGAGTAAHPSAADITLTSCGADDTGFSSADASITNHSSKASDYNFQVNFINASGVVVDQGYGFENNLAAGQTATTQVMGGTGGAPAKCQVVDVSRTESF
jgi:hypothetical protein